MRAGGRVVCERCLVIETVPARMRGLLGRDRLVPGDGVLLRPASSVHTFSMRFPIDVVFVDADQRVVRVVDALRPWRVAWARRARAVVELAAGEARRHDVRVAERLELAPPG